MFVNVVPQPSLVANLLLSKFITFFAKYLIVFSNNISCPAFTVTVSRDSAKSKVRFENAPKNPPDCIVSNTWVFDNFILAYETIAKD